MQNLQSNWPPAVFPDTSDVCFLVCYSCKQVVWPVGMRRGSGFVYTLWHDFVIRGAIYITMNLLMKATPIHRLYPTECNVTCMGPLHKYEYGINLTHTESITHN